MDKSREQFDEWFDKTIANPIFSDEEKEALSVYCWSAWRDSRRAIEVEPPEDQRLGGDEEWYQGYRSGWKDCVIAIKRSIKSIGLKVKP